jgi:GNAT superfamily N-acetyltransferase
MIDIIKTDSSNPDFIELVVLLDQYLAIIDGEEHAFYAQFNTIQKLQHVIVAYKNNVPVGCGAIKNYSEDTAEVKRMFVMEEYRGQGIAKHILSELEIWAAALNFSYCVLETGKKQPDAIKLYQKSNYLIIPSYGQYINIENSVCMKKDIKRKEAEN